MCPTSGMFPETHWRLTTSEVSLQNPHSQTTHGELCFRCWDWTHGITYVRQGLCCLANFKLNSCLVPLTAHMGTKVEERSDSIKHRVQDVAVQNEVTEKRKMQNKASCYWSVRVIGALGCKFEQWNWGFTFCSHLLSNLNLSFIIMIFLISVIKKKQEDEI